MQQQWYNFHNSFLNGFGFHFLEFTDIATLQKINIQ